MTDEELRAALLAYVKEVESEGLDTPGPYGSRIRALHHIFTRLLELLPPADDAEPVTAEWLTAVGFMMGKFPDDLVIGPVLRGVIHNAQSPANGQWYWTVRTYPIPMEHQPITRGCLRRLCSALGIQLKEVNQ